MFTVDFSILSTPDVAEWQDGLRVAAVSALPAVGQALVEHSDRCFETGSDPWGAAWAPHAPSTQRARASESAKILIDTGALRMSLHANVEAGENGDAVVRVSVGGPAAAYAAVHQWGSRDGRIPARPFLPLRGTPENPLVELPPELHDEVIATLQAAIDRFVANANATRGATQATGTGG